MDKIIEKFYLLVIPVIVVVMLGCIAWSMWTPAKINSENQKKIIQAVNIISKEQKVLKKRVDTLVDYLGAQQKAATHAHE